MCTLSNAFSKSKKQMYKLEFHYWYQFNTLPVSPAGDVPFLWQYYYQAFFPVSWYKFIPYLCQKLVNLFYRCFEVNSYSSFVMLSYPGAFPFFSSLIAVRISFKVGFSVFIRSTIAPSVSISADAGGSGPLRTSLKFHSSVILLHFLLSEVTHFSPLYV